MQSMSKAAALDPNRPAKLTLFNTLGYIYRRNGLAGLYRGLSPRIGLGVFEACFGPGIPLYMCKSASHHPSSMMFL